jgi:hypothetical protein
VSVQATAAAYDLDGHMLQVLVPHDAALKSVDRIIGDLRSASVKKPDYTLAISERALSPVPDDARLLYAGPVFDIRDCAFHEFSGGYHVRFADEAAVIILPCENRALIEVAPDRFGVPFGTSLLTALEAAVDAFGQTIIHAAGVTLPGSDRVLLLHAASGVGKTTTTLRLAGEGFGICSDDTMVLRVDEDMTRCWGLPGDLKVHRLSAAMLPWLTPMLGPDWNAEGEQALTRGKLAGLAKIEPSASLPVAALFHLVRDSAHATSVWPMSNSEALAELAMDNVRTSNAGLLPLQKRRFAIMARLTTNVPTFLLRIGPDTSGLGRMLAACVS